MLHEYALDPGILNDWQFLQFMLGNFGIPQGRLISDFPRKKWKRMVYDTSNACREVDRHRIVQLLKYIDPKLTDSLREYNSEKPWIENAIIQHADNPFQAIITGSKSEGQPHILIPEDLHETNPYWVIGREQIVEKRAEAMAAMAARLLNISSHILFIDPHFKPHELRYRRPLELFLDQALIGQNLQRIEYHLKTDANGPTAEYFEQKCSELARHIITEGAELTFYRWKLRDSGDAFHARYILTELGGIRFEYGLDEAPGGSTTDITLLDTTVYSRRWSEFQVETAAYDLHDKFVVTGQKRRQ